MTLLPDPLCIQHTLPKGSGIEGAAYCGEDTSIHHQKSILFIDTDSYAVLKLEARARNISVIQTNAREFIKRKGFLLMFD